MFVARQPIFNRSLKVYGYELLYRETIKSKSFSNASAKTATALVIGELFEQGKNKMTGKAKAFVNFDYEFLMSDMIELIDPEVLIIEVLETVKVDTKLLMRLVDLRGKGYKIALDDFEEDFFTFKAISCVDIIKYDILSTPLESIKVEVREAIHQNKTLLAEKIETEEEFLKAKSMGFHLFQGYFFSKPKIVENKKKRTTSKVIYSQILNELKGDDFSFDNLAHIIESDVDLSYRLLCILSNNNKDNAFNSIKGALVRMGKKEIERWINVIILQNIAEDKPDEIFRLSLVRSRFSELVSANSKFHIRKDEISMMFLFSMLDVLLDCTMEEALEGVSISEDVVKVLVEHKGTLNPIFIFIQAYEKGNWEQVDTYSKVLHIDVSKLAEWYMSSIEWANSIMGYHD